MERLQRNGATAGFVAAILVALAVILGYNAPGFGATFRDPAAVLGFIAGNRWLWRAIRFIGILTSGFAVVFSIGIWSRLRERTPTRAAAGVAFALIGLAGYALSDWIRWSGGIAMASYATRDQAAAVSAWLAISFAARGATELGRSFLGTALVLVGWAIITTGAMRTAVGWVAVFTGVLTLLFVVPALSIPEWVELAQAVLTIVLLVWAGSELRHGGNHPG